MALVGDTLSEKIKSWTGATPDMSCACNALLREMNAKGPQWSRDNMKRIVKTIRNNARSAPKKWKLVRIANSAGYWVPGVEAGLKVFIRSLVLSAIEESE